MINKENKLQSLLMAVELNRTAANDQRRSQAAVSKEHYQSHREFGRDLSNNGQNTSQSIVNTKVVGHIQSTTNQAGNNVSLFKNFISQYQSQSSSNNQTKNTSASTNNTQVVNGQMSKLDLNKINTSHNQNYPSSRGNNHHSTVVADEQRAPSSQGLNLKTFDNGSRNQGGAHSTNIIRESAKLGEPHRRK